MNYTDRLPPHRPDWVGQSAKIGFSAKQIRDMNRFYFNDAAFDSYNRKFVMDIETAGKDISFQRLP